jgi:addiction module HigA family antidote
MRKEYFVKPEEIIRPPTRPGLLFAEEILPLGRRTIGEIATLLGVSRQRLHRVMAGESAITPDMAVRLGKLCGNGPDLWLRMQAAYDGWEASKRLKREIEKIPVLR